MSDDYPYTEKRRIDALVDSLREIQRKDPEQEVQGIALPVVDAVVSSLKAKMPNDLVVHRLADVISADMIGSGDPVRAADLLLVAVQLQAALGDGPPVVA